MDATSNEISSRPPGPVAEEEQLRQQDERQRPAFRCSPSINGLVLSDGVVRAIFLLLGVGILIPWNAFVSAKPYFTARLCQSGHDIVNFEQWFGVIWNSSSVCSLGLIIIGQSLLDYWKTKKSQQSLSNLDELNNNAATPADNAHVVSEVTSEHRTNSLRTRSRNVEDDRFNDSSPSASSNGSSGGNKDNSFYNVMVPLGLYTLVFSIQALLVTIPDISPTHFLIVTLVGLALCGTCGAIATAGIISTAGLFPSHIGINPFFSGQALGGAAVSIANFAAIAIGEDPADYLEKHCVPATNHSQEVATDYSIVLTTERRLDVYMSLEGPDNSCSPYQILDWAVFSYFLTGCIVLLLCLVGYHKIHLYQNMRHRDDYETVHDHEHRDSSSISNTDEVDEISPGIGLEINDLIHQRQQTQHADDNETLIVSSGSERATTISNHELVPNNYNANETSTSIMPAAQMIASSSNNSCIPAICGGVNSNDDDDDDDDNDNENQIELDRFDDEEEEEYTDNLDTKSVSSAIKGPATCIFLTFTITLSLFPSWISELKSSHECENRLRLSNDLYVPFSFVVFNIGDLLGRLISGYIPVEQIRNLSQKLVVCAMLRVVFWPLLLMCLSTTGKDSNMVIRNDFFSLSVQLLFAVSNGLLISTSFMWSPHLVGTTTNLQERASEIMTFSVFFGLLSGSFLAFPFLQFATRVLE